MKRKEQLAPLSREHHQSLVLAKKCIDISRSNDMALITAQCKQIVQNFDEIWESHFMVEEQTLFTLAASYSKQLQCLCDDLAKQHQLLREMKQQMQQGNYNSLETFGIIPKTHTRTEERELFPQIERFFNQDDLNEVLRASKENNDKRTQEE
jgi:hemerythrin-like domain-containing protein